MGRTYYAIGNSRLEFNTNFSGADILGFIMFEADEHNKSLVEHDKKYNITNRPPTTLYKTTGKECQRAVTKLEALTDEQYQNILSKCKGLIEPYTVDELKRWTQEWIGFLKQCKKGYLVA